MPDLYNQQSWFDGSNGGTPLDALRLNHIENGLNSVANAVSDLQDQVGALVVGSGTVAATKIDGGPTANRPAPTLNRIYRDTDLGKVLFGTGSSWVLADGTAVSGAGGSNAPQNFTAETQADNSILCSWSAVAGATSYKLYETQSPSGVAGATALATTSTSRTPSTQRTYEYWVTATVGGVESAASNHAQATLPYVTPGSGGGGGGGSPSAGSPAALLNMGGTGGFWNIGIGLSTGHVDTPYSQLISGYTNAPYYCLNSAGDAVQFQIFANGATTSKNTHYPRSELREFGSDGTTKAAWTAGSGTHIMQYDARVLHLPPNKPWTTVGQIHDPDSDALSIKFKGDDTSHLSITPSIYDTNQSALVSSYTLGDWVTIKIELTNGTLNLYANGTQKVTSTALQGKGSGHYFKVGDYMQTADDWGGFESPTEYGLVEIKNLFVSHSPAI